jgi:hypothetical protein
MPGVLAWVVAIERHTPTEGVASPLDFGSPVSSRALDLIEWVLEQHAGVRVLLNLATPDESPSRVRANALGGQILNPTLMYRADAAALRESLRKAKAAPVPDLLLLVWIGHGVMVGRQRFLLHEGSRDADQLESWDVDTLLLHLRSGEAPARQIGIIDTCAQVVDLQPDNQQFGGAGKAQCDQHYFFAATASAIASLSLHEPTLVALALESLRAVGWTADGPPPRAFSEDLRNRMAALGSRPVVWQWTQGSGDQWSGGSASAVSAAELRRATETCRLPQVLFTRLLQEVADTGITPRDLARAVKQSAVETLARTLEAKSPDAAEGLIDTWTLVQRVAAWVEPLARLHLGLAQWSGLAALVAADDGRSAPAFTEVSELLLWTADMAGRRPDGSLRADMALLRLMVLAMKEARRTPVVLTAVQRVHKLLSNHPVHGPRLAEIEAAAELPEEAPTIVVDVEFAPKARQPLIRQHWVRRGEILERIDLASPASPLPQALNRIIGAVQQREHARVRVEMLAPFAVLLGRFEWRSYIATLSGLPGVGKGKAVIDLDARYPIYVRWKERLQGLPTNEWQTAHWTQRARDVQLMARQASQLKCNFDDDPVAGESHVLALAWQPGNRDQQRFLTTLLRGEPYMIWPGKPQADVDAFKQAVRVWLADQSLDRLPEAVCQAIAAKVLCGVVLLLDEPDRNPYRLMQPLQAMDAPPLA